jgi:uncharacterized protein YecT (DUF1311 family)
MRIAEVICGLIVKQGNTMRMCFSLCLIICLAISNVYAASFDCKKAKTEIEKMICSDGEASQFDEELARKYKKALTLVSYKDQMKKQQQEWIKTLRNACKDETCLQREYRDRIAAMNSTLVAAALHRKLEEPKVEWDRIIFAVAKKLKWEKPYDWGKDSKKDTERKQFCEALLVDLQAGKEVEFVEPIVRTDDYNDPKLQAYLGKCPRLKPIKNVQYQPDIWDYFEESKVPEEERDYAGMIYYSSADFKLYHVDFDGNPENGKEYLFYGGCGYEYGHPGGLDSRHYGILDLDRCKDVASIQVRETLNYRTRQPTKDTNGVIQYKSKYYIYDYVHSDFKNNYIRLHQWDDKSVSNTNWACTFHE